MILVAGGDSFIFGAELKDQFISHSMNTFPALLAKMYNMEYVCAAWSGNANNAISRMTMTKCNHYISQNKKIGALVTWTFTNRYEFRFNYHTLQKISPWHTINAWSVLDDIDSIKKEFKSMDQNAEEYVDTYKENIERSKKTGVADFAKTFFKHVGNSSYYEIYTSLKEILFLQLYFKQNQIPYMFVTADNQFFNHSNYEKNKDENLEILYTQIDWDKWYFFSPGVKVNETNEPRGFYQWAVENKYPIGTTHPLEEAHNDAAHLIKDTFDELVTKPLEQNSIRN